MNRLYMLFGPLLGVGIVAGGTVTVFTVGLQFLRALRLPATILAGLALIAVVLI
jgi:hypothetical protein